MRKLTRSLLVAAFPFFVTGVVYAATGTRVTDTVTMTSEAAPLLGGRKTSATTLVSRVVSAPTADGGAWTITYERMLVDGKEIGGVQGRAYAVTVADDSLTVEPIAPTDSTGLSGVQEDVALLRSMFSVSPQCEIKVPNVCPALQKMLQRFGTAKATATGREDTFGLEITTPAGDLLRGTLLLTPDKWAVDVSGRRVETITFEVDGQRKSSSAEISMKYVILREFVTIPEAAVTATGGAN